MKKLITASIIALLLLAALPSVEAKGDKIMPYQGWVGADSPLYGIKIFIQHLDISLAGNSNEKLHKQIIYADERLAEALAAAAMNNSEALEAALNAYNETMNDVNETMEQEDVNETAYEEIGEDIDEHEDAIGDLLNDTTAGNRTQAAIFNALTGVQKVKSGRPFVTYNDTTYFIPPGHWKKGINSTWIPSGLAKKGIQSSRDLWTLNDTDAINQTNKQLGIGKDRNNGNGNGKK